eukprot:GDKK01077491.1.p1 GENE.GDKK01077491.1~~GDKK01077491.1.p1  ORF type:complete len:204 (-),score=66.16 GDKK01077491.1:92-703(-)
MGTLFQMSIKVNYFDISGKALAIRLALVYAGVNFEDNRVQFGDWPAMKPNTPLGYLPVVEVDGVQHTQSAALARYFGRKAGLYGKTDEETLAIDQAMDIVFEATTFPKEDSARPEFIQNVTRRNFAYLNKLYAAHNSGYAIASGISIADLCIYAAITFSFSGFYTNVPSMADMLAEYPALKKAVENVRSHEKFAAYFAKHDKE